MATRNGQVLLLSGSEDEKGSFIIDSIQADTTNKIYQILDGSTSDLWNPNAAGDVISFDDGIKVDGLATTGASDGFQVFLK